MSERTKLDTIVEEEVSSAGGDEANLHLGKRIAERAYYTALKDAACYFPKLNDIHLQPAPAEPTYGPCSVCGMGPIYRHDGHEYAPAEEKVKGCFSTVVDGRTYWQGDRRKGERRKSAPPFKRGYIASRSGEDVGSFAPHIYQEKEHDPWQHDRRFGTDRRKP